MKKRTVFFLTMFLLSVNVVSVFLAIFSGSNQVQATGNLINVTIARNTPIMAMFDWFDVTMEIPVNQMKNGDVLELSMEGNVWDFSTEAIKGLEGFSGVGTADGKITITKNSDAVIDTIALNYPMRFKENVKQQTSVNFKVNGVIVGSEITLTSNEVPLTVNRYVDTVNPDELVNIVSLGFTSNRDAAWVIHWNYNKIPLLGNSTNPFIFALTTTGKHTIKGMSVYHVTNPIIDNERNPDHDYTNHGTDQNGYYYYMSLFFNYLLKNSQIDLKDVDETFKSFKKEYPSIDVDSLKNDFQNKAYYIYFETAVADDFQPNELLMEKVYMEIGGEGGEPRKWDKDALIGVKVPGQAGEKIELKVKKQWVGVNEDQLPKEVEIALYKNEDWVAECSLSAENQWQYTFKNLDKKNSEGQINLYSIKEVNPEGFFTSIVGENPSVEGGATLYSGFTITNFGGIIIRKVDSSTPSSILTGAKFNIYKKDTNEKVSINNSTDFEVDANGELVIGYNALPAGEYYLQESVAPPGYALSDEQWLFTIPPAGTPIKSILYEFKNSIKDLPPELPDKGSVTLTKTGNQAQKLAGVVFELCDASGNSLTPPVFSTTDGEGKVKFSNLEYGQYSLIERKTQEDYQLDETPQYFEISEINKDVSLKMENKLIETGNVLPLTGGQAGSQKMKQTFALSLVVLAITVLTYYEIKGWKKR